MNSFLQEFCQEMRGIEGINAQNENKNNKSVEKMDRSKAKKKGHLAAAPKGELKLIQ